MNKVNNVIYFPASLNIRSGGPSGYIANLVSGLNAHPSVTLITRNKERERTPKAIAKSLSFFLPTKEQRAKLRHLLTKLLLDFSLHDNALHRYHLKQLDDLDFKSITCHRVQDVEPIKRYLEKRNHKALIILMSHSPEAPSMEAYNAAIESGKSQSAAALEQKKHQEIEKIAFQSADILLFPSKESMEPYDATFDGFSQLIESKHLVFMETGAQELHCNISKTEVYTKYNLDNLKYNVCYIGRHNSVKGYDLLQNAAKEILTKRDDIRFVIGGRPSALHAPLNNPNWVELGYINPAEVLSVCDLFVLPNRQTYFDLVLLEVLSAGVPVLASSTGGNKTVYATTEGAIELFENQNELAGKIQAAADRDIAAQDQLRWQSRSAYEKHYSVEHFAKRYINLVSKILSQENSNV